ncbi:MAG TPA: methyltransferase domain-containing protein [Streptosporangiaceae bacterium]|nr:methyltransferase domain-containing protein [Streptosporangiaceae bacterium]
MADSYLTLAADYDWLFRDEGLTGGNAINSPAAARVLKAASRGSAVLDASCGTGINAAVLARRGFDVWATDGSEAMIEQAAARFRDARVPDLVPPLHRRRATRTTRARRAEGSRHRLRCLRRPLRGDRGGELT